MIALMPSDLQDGVASPWSSTASASQSQPTSTDDSTDYGDESDDGSWDGVTTIQNDPWGTAASAQAQATGVSGTDGQQQQSGNADETYYRRWGRRMVQL